MGFSFGLNDAWKAVRGLPHEAKEAAGEVKDVVEDVVDAARYLKDHPPSLDRFTRTVKAVGETIRTGESALIQGRMPAYVAPDAAALAAARARGEGRSVEQPFITHDQAGHGHHEPVSLRVTGSLDDLARALEATGWREAPKLGPAENLKMAAKMVFGLDRDTNGPVSDMYVNGRKAVTAFNKNDDYNAGRDHLRIFPAGTDPKTGEPVWEMAATRDIAATITVPHPTLDGWKPRFQAPRTGHRTDPAIDRERDLIMHDLLASGAVGDWAAVKGVRRGVPETPLPDGGARIGARTTDGLVYDIRLKGD